MNRYDPKSMLRCYNTLLEAIDQSGGAALDVMVNPDMPVYDLLDILGRNNISFVYNKPDQEELNEE